MPVRANACAEWVRIFSLLSCADLCVHVAHDVLPNIWRGMRDCLIAAPHPLLVKCTEDTYSSRLVPYMVARAMYVVRRVHAARHDACKTAMWPYVCAVHGAQHRPHLCAVSHAPTHHSMLLPTIQKGLTSQRLRPCRTNMLLAQWLPDAALFFLTTPAEVPNGTCLQAVATLHVI